MSKISLTPNASGTGNFTIASPATNTDRTLTLPDNTGTIITTASTFAGTGPAFFAYSTAGQSVSNGTATKVQLNNELFDTASCFDSSTNYRFTPTVAGYYQVNGNVLYGGGYTNVGAYSYIYKNGSNLIAGSQGNSGSTGLGASSTVSGIVYCDGTSDYIEFYTQQFRGGALSIQTDSTGTTFSAALIRGA